MSITKLAQAALALSLTLTALPSHAGITSAQRRQFGSLLADAGVEIKFTEVCHEPIAGAYDHRTKTMEICLNNLRSGDDMDETVAHEAVHVAQHCAARRLGVVGLLPLHSLLVDNIPLANRWLQDVDARVAHKQSDINASYRFNSRGITLQLEREAYAWEEEPEAVFGFLKAACQLKR